VEENTKRDNTKKRMEGAAIVPHMKTAISVAEN
jgi:hypothetical protein